MDPAMQVTPLKVVPYALVYAAPPGLAVAVHCVWITFLLHGRNSEVMPVKVPAMVVTLATLHLLIPRPSKASAALNVFASVVTFAVSQEPMFPFIAVAP